MSAWDDLGLLLMTLVRGAAIECKDVAKLPAVTCWLKALDLELLILTNPRLSDDKVKEFRLKVLVEFLWGVQKAGGYHDIKAMQAFYLREQILASTTYKLTVTS